jgi:peptidoglycan/xylan/chitin deacetylase (PgdA/CDA1 family)
MKSLRRLTFAAGFAAMALALPAWAGAAPTVVSLTFDDGWGSQTTAASALAAHGMRGTFYVNTNTLGTAGFLSWAQLTALDSAGNEITGHTLDHPNLTVLSSTEAQRQVCDDRANLLARGFVATSFAYPFGEFNSTTKTIVQNCGYSSGRGAFGLHNITATNDTRPYAEGIPPLDRYAIRTPCCIEYAAFGNSTPTAAALENYVAHAESGGGGLVAFVFHRICDNCGNDDPAPSMTPAEFEAFLDWLQPRAANGTVVKTVAQVIKNDAQPPSSSIACGGLACSSGWYGAPVSVSLSATDAGTAGVAAIRYTTDGSEPTVASPAYSGPFTVSATTTVKYRAWDNAGNLEGTKSQLVRVDTTAPVSSIACGGAICSSGWYGGPVSVALSATDSESGVAAIRYTTDGSTPTEASSIYTAPFTVDATTTVKFRAWDNAGNAEATNSQLIQFDTTGPSSSISCNDSTCSTSTYSSAVTVALSATDTESGVDVIRYTLDGSDPTAASTAYTDPFTVSETTTVKFRAWDNVGNVEGTNSQLVQVAQIVPDTEAPTSSIACNLSACSSGWYNGPVSVSLAAADGGSGVAAIRYTLDGSDPTASSPAYANPFIVSTTATVKFRAWDNAGNVEATKSQLVQVDTTAPTSSITCNGGTCSTNGWYKLSVNVALSAADSQSGVAVIRYTLDGSTPSASSPAYTAPFTVSTTTTVKYRAWDNAGNVETTKSQSIRVDLAPPTVAITSPSDGATLTGSVKITAAASDAGSGVVQVSFYADGSLIGTARSAPYTINWNTRKVSIGQHTLWAVAQDVAGNSQTSASIRVTIR